MAALLPASDAQAATRAPRQAATNESVSSLADCSARTGRLFVVFLVDESASLRKTDPEDRRIEGIQTALAAFAQVADRTADSEVPVTVEVSMVGFGVDATEVVGWRPLDGGTLPDLLRASDAFAKRDNQIDTDYAAALLGARDQIGKVVDPAAPDQSCSAILWFTDGKYDIEPRSTGERKPYAPEIAIDGAASAAALQQAGKNLICSEGGVVDGLRLGGTEMLAVALSTQIAPEDQDFLRSVAEGTGAQPCGVARPEGAPLPGAYLGSADISGLIAGFFDTASEVGGGTAGPAADNVPVCPNTGCESGTHRFPVDPGIMAFNLLAVSSADGIDVELASPEAGIAPLNISPTQRTGTGSLGGAEVHWTWVSADAVLIDVALPEEQGPWNGDWSVTFVDRSGASPGAVADAHIYVFGDVEPYLDETTFRAGEDNAFLVGVRHREGTPVDERLFTDVVVDATIVNPNDGTREQLALGPLRSDGKREGTWKGPAPDFPATVNVSVTARVTTSSGQALTPVTRTTAVEVLPPSSYPSVSPVRLRFPTLTSTDPVEAVLTVTGGAASGGCVWIEGSEVVQSPDDAGKVALAPLPAAVAKDSCLHVDAGEETELRISLTPASASNGSAAGNLEISLVSDTNPDLLRTTVAWTVPLQKPVDTEVRNKVFAELMAIGLLLPLLLMWLLNWLTAKFEPPSKVKYAVVKAMVSKEGTVNRSDAKETGLGVRADDFRALDLEGRKRAFDAGPLHFRSRTRLSPFAAPTGEVSAPGFAVGTLPPLALGRTADRSTVPFGLAGTAVVLVPQPALTAEGDERPDLEITLVLFAPADELSRYTTHFDGHRDTVKSIVSRLWERSRDDVARRKHEADKSATEDRPKRSGRPKVPAADRTQESSGGPPGRRSGQIAAPTGDVDGPPPRRSAAGDGGPPPRQDARAGSQSGPPGRRPAATDDGTSRPSDDPGAGGEGGPPPRRASPADGGSPARAHTPGAAAPTGPPPRRTGGNGSDGPPGRSGANGDPARTPTTPHPTSDERSDDPAPPPRRGSY